MDSFYQSYIGLSFSWMMLQEWIISAAQLLVADYYIFVASGQEHTGYPKNMPPEQKHIHRKKIVGKKASCGQTEDHRKHQISSTITNFFSLHTPQDLHPMQQEHCPIKTHLNYTNFQFPSMFHLTKLFNLNLFNPRMNLFFRPVHPFGYHRIVYVHYSEQTNAVCYELSLPAAAVASRVSSVQAASVSSHDRGRTPVRRKTTISSASNTLCLSSSPFHMPLRMQ